MYEGFSHKETLTIMFNWSYHFNSVIIYHHVIRFTRQISWDVSRCLAQFWKWGHISLDPRLLYPGINNSLKGGGILYYMIIIWNVGMGFCTKQNVSFLRNISYGWEKGGVKIKLSHISFTMRGWQSNCPNKLSRFFENTSSF